MLLTFDVEEEIVFGTQSVRLMAPLLLPPVPWGRVPAVPVPGATLNQLPVTHPAQRLTLTL